MSDAPTYSDPRTLARLQDLRLRARHVVEGYVAGLHRSPFRGFSIEFSEHREYAPGDDLRHVDWKVVGRSDRFVVKQYEDETNLVCHLLLDVSESMTYQGPDAPWSKLDHARCAAASLAWLVLRGQDAVGLTTFDDEIRGEAPASGSAAQMGQVLGLLEQPPASGARTRLGPLLALLAQRIQRRGVVILLSDLLDDIEPLLTGLRRFRHRRHDLIVMQVLDPAELELPYHSPTLFRGLEGLPDVAANPAALRTAYREEIDRHRQRLQEQCAAQGADYLLLRTDEPLEQALTRYLSRRAARVQ